MNSKNGKLMIVDDSKFQRAVLKELLQDLFELVEVESGEACLEMFEKEIADVDIVLLDIVMTGMDGFEVLHRRQRIKKFRDTPVIVLTTSESDAFQTKAFAMGADEYIAKPIDRRVALSRIYNVLGIGQRMQNLKQQHERLREKAEIDEMTKLLNKATAEKLISRHLESSPKNLHALMVIDIDNFKAVNDIYGHSKGDHTIKTIARLLTANFDDNSYVGRVGGDEFVVLMKDISSKAMVRKKAQCLIRECKEKADMDIPENISLSIGVAFSEESDVCYEDLFRKADKALYHAKKAGKGCYFEFGAVPEYEVQRKKVPYVLGYTNSRNVSSVLEFAFGEEAEYCQISDSVWENMQIERKPAVIYVDVSECEDHGKEIWARIEAERENEKMIPMIAICQEGNMQQVRLALESEMIVDLLFAPVDVERVRRRSKALELLK